MPITSITDPESLQQLLEAVVLINRDLSLPSVLRQAVDEAQSMTNARYGAIALLDDEGIGIEEFVTVGPTAPEQVRVGPTPPYKLSSGPSPIGASLSVPITVRDQVYGSFSLTEKVGSPNFTRADQALLEVFAAAVGIAVEHARLRALAGAASLSTDRDAAARDLHDTTIQRLFGLGLKLQSLVGASIPPDVSQDLSAAVAHIDDIIDQVRMTIFEDDRDTT